MTFSSARRSSCMESLEKRCLFAVNPTDPPQVLFHLTASQWAPLNVQDTDYLAAAERIVRALAPHQDAAGHIIDPYTGDNEKTSTPYFAYAIGVLNSAGRAADLLPAGIRAMDVATTEMAETVNGDDDDGNTFLEPLSGALSLYASSVPAEQLAAWRERLDRPIDELADANLNNHRAYAMKGEWARALAGLVTREQAIAYIEANWTGSQRDRIADDALKLYHDRSSNPDSMATETVGRVQLLWILANGYDGPSRAEMDTLLFEGTKNLLALQDPTGQAPNSGRATGAVWNDTNAAMCFEMMASISAQKGDITLAQQYRRAADLALKSVSRWEMPDGSQAVLKNLHDPSQRVGYVRYNSWSNSNASQAYRFASIYKIRAATTPLSGEAPTPAEIGGYAVLTDGDFSTAFADAGGLQIEASLRGAVQETHDRYWSTLGITRFSKAGWDSRLGPSDGQRDGARAVSFAPEFLKTDTGWDRVSELPETYTAKLDVQFVSPVLIRATMDYTPKNAADGPTFHQDLIITPDGVLSTLSSSAAPGSFAMTLPVLVSDGKSILVNTFSANIATIRYADGSDEQNYISLDSAPEFTTTDAPIQGPYGDIRPVRMLSSGATNTTFVYPRSAGQPTAQTVYSTWTATADGFSSALGRVSGTTYVGRTSAGGEGTGIDINFDGSADITFSENCVFVMQRAAGGRITGVETDRAVTMTVGGNTFTLAPHTPLAVNLAFPPPMPEMEENQPPVVQINTPPVAGLTSQTTIEAVVADDDLPVGSNASIAWSQTSGPGTVTFADAAATLTTASFSQEGTYILRATVSDGALSSFAEATIVVGDVSALPVAAVDDRVERPVGQGIDVDVRANDGNAAGSQLTLTLVSQPANGVATINTRGTDDLSDDTIQYTPDDGFYGEDTFTYRLENEEGASAQATVQVGVARSATLIPDPADASKTALLVVGNAESEKIKLVKKRTQLRVLINRVQVGDLLDFPTGSVIILANGGNDIVSAAAIKTLPVHLYGGDGDDQLTGTKFSDILIGGEGNDLLTGAAGADLLIGGNGADRITGGAGDDAILTSATPYDPHSPENAGALREILTLWNVATPYAERVTAMTAASWANDLLSDDASPDTANGSGGKDLFYAFSLTDRIKRTATETIVGPQ